MKEESIASVLDRVKGYLGDFIVVSGFVLIAGFLFEDTKANLIAIIIFSILSFLYFVFLNYFWKGQTIGKKMVKTKIVAIHGELTLKQLAVRYLVFFAFTLSPSILRFITQSREIGDISGILFPLVFLGAIIVNESHRGFHDMVAKTKVVSLKPIREVVKK